MEAVNNKQPALLSPTLDQKATLEPEIKKAGFGHLHEALKNIQETFRLERQGIKFLLADSNHDGHLTKKEWRQANLGSEAEFKKFDVNHKGGVSLREFLARSPKA